MSKEKENISRIKVQTFEDFKKKERKMIKDFDDILIHVGEYGKYQKLFIAFILVPTSFFIATIINLLLFQTLVPEKYWCNPPGRELTNYTQEEWWNLTVPRTENGTDFEKCVQYDFDIIEIPDKSYSILIKNNKTKDCLSTWAHDKASFYESVATSMNYFCEKEIYSTHIFSIQTVGAILGTLLLPIIADKFTGRRLMFFITAGIHFVFNLLFLVVPTYGLLLFTRFCEGVAFQADYQMPYVIGLELMSPDNRAAASFYSFVAWTAGMCFTAFIAWLIPNWWYLGFIMCFISAIFFGYWSFLPMSPRWLLAKGRIDESVEVLLMVAKVNKKEVDRPMLEKELKILSSAEEKDGLNPKFIFKHKRMMFHALLLTFYSLTVFMAYGCTLVNVNILPDNVYLSFFVLSLSELPSNIMSYLSVHYLGRRFTAVFTALASIVFCVMATFFLETRGYLLFIVAMIKVFSTQGIYVLYVMSAEIFPTPIRTIGMGVVVVFGMAGIFCSKYVVQASGNGPLQYWVMFALEISALLFSLPIPETIGLPLPQTFMEAENLGKNRPFFKWVHHWNKQSFINNDVKVDSNKESM